MLCDVDFSFLHAHVHEQRILRPSAQMNMCALLSMNTITPTVVGVYRDWPGSSALNLYI